MSSEYDAKDFVMLSIDTTNRPEMSREYIESVGAGWPILMDDQEIAGENFGIQGVPTNLFLDQDGRIVFKQVGFREGMEDGIRAMIDALVERKNRSS